MLCSDVNKAWRVKAKTKAKTSAGKTKTQAKTSADKAKTQAKALSLKAIRRPRPQKSGFKAKARVKTKA